MEFMLKACGLEKKKKDKEGKKHKYKKGALTLLVHGVDDVASGHAKGEIKAVEAGAWIHGVLLVKLERLPENPFAFAKFELSSRYQLELAHTTHHTDEEGNEHQLMHYSHEKEKWLKGTTKVPLQPLPGVPVFQDEQGLWNIQFPFSYVVPPDMCDSFKRGDHFCRYDLKCKLKFAKESDGSKIKVKGIKRQLDIMARRPSNEELLKPGKTHKDNHMSFSGGGVAVECTLDANCFIEGSQVVFTARVKNGMERPVMTGKLELEEHLTNSILYTSDKDDKSWSKKKRTRDLVVSKLRGLEIPALSTKVVKFALELPEVVEPPTTGFDKSHHTCRVQHILKLQLDVPWGSDIRMSFPVRIAPNPARYWVPGVLPTSETEPVSLDAVPVEIHEGSGSMLPQVDMSTVALPAGYACIPPEALVEYTPWQDPRPKFLAIELVAGHKLPKMDFTFGGLRGGADPYVTIWVNDIHVRTSRTVSNNQNPVFHEKFRFWLTEKDLQDVVTFKFNCYDYDSTSKDDLIGNGTFAFDPREGFTRFGEELSISLTREKKGKMKDRGTLTFKILEFHSFQ